MSTNTLFCVLLYLIGKHIFDLNDVVMNYGTGHEKSLQDSIDVAIVAVLITHKYETLKTQMYLNKCMDMQKNMYTYIYVLAKLNTYPPIYYLYKYIHTYTHDKQK